jgi:hypothetical protein
VKAGRRSLGLYIPTIPGKIQFGSVISADIDSVIHLRAESEIFPVLVDTLRVRWWTDMLLSGIVHIIFSNNISVNETPW